MPHDGDLVTNTTALFLLNVAPHEKMALGEKIDKALEQGKEVRWRHSSFTDPGEDWNAIVIDGVEVFRQAGY